MSDYLQGAFRMPADATIRTTNHSTGDTIDWVVSEGDIWESVDAIVAEWLAVFVVAYGFEPDISVAIVETASTYTGTLRITTTGATFSIDWSHAGDGTSLRNFLGEAGNAATESSGYDFAAAHKCGWYVAEDRGGAQEGTRQADRTRYAGRAPLLGGNTQTQHSTSPGDVDGGSFDLLLRYDHGSGDQEGPSALEAFIDEIHDTTGALPRFTLTYLDGARTSQIRLGENVEVNHRLVDGSASLEEWQTTISCEVAG